MIWIIDNVFYTKIEHFKSIKETTIPVTVEKIK